MCGRGFAPRLMRQPPGTDLVVCGRESRDSSPLNRGYDLALMVPGLVLIGGGEGFGLRKKRDRWEYVMVPLIGASESDCIRLGTPSRASSASSAPARFRKWRGAGGALVRNARA